MRGDERASRIPGAGLSGERRFGSWGLQDLFFDNDSRDEPFEMGLASDGERIICVTYDPEEYRSLWGGGVEEYKDFLIRRQMAVNYHRGPWFSVQTVPVPFDREAFEEWLNQSADATTYSDQHGQWALSMYGSPDKLAAIRARHPLSYSVPTYETLEVVSCGWILPIIVQDDACGRRLGRTLPLQLIDNVMKELTTKFLGNIIPLERLSPYRARGAAIIPADRLVPPERACALCLELESRVASVFPHELPSHLRVSSRWRPRTSASRGYPCVQVLCLPLVIVGSSADADDVGIRLSRIPSDATLQARWNEFLLPLGAKLREDRFMFIHPAREMGQLARHIAHGLEFEDDS